MADSGADASTSTHHSRPAGPSSVQRQEWMLAPPPSASVAEQLRADPRAALKSRGFSQSGAQRVQRHGGGGKDGEDATLWTETPAERQQRLLDEEMGVRAKGASSAAGQGPRDEEGERRREDRIRAAVQAHAASRGPSLLEQHQAKRRAELRKDEKRSSRRHDKRDDGSDDDRERSRRRRHRDERSVSPSRDSESRRHRSHHSHRREREDKRHGESSHRSSKDEPSHRHRHHRHRHDSESDDDKEERRRRRREKEEKKRQRDKEERQEKTGAPMMVWDRDAAMSVGGRLMDDRKRLDVIKSASSLNDRFGSGQSRYM